MESAGALDAWMTYGRLDVKPGGSQAMQPLLEAIDGIAYIVGLDRTVVAIGQASWDRALAAHPRQACPRAAEVIGHNLFDFIAGDDVKGRYEDWLRLLAVDPDAKISFGFRCDAPAEERQYQMSITRLEEGGEAIGFLFQSTLVSSAKRPPIDLYDFEARLEYARGRTQLPTVIICSFCERINWEAIGFDSWHAPEQYYAAGGTSQVRISHGLCSDCLETLPSI